MDERLKVIFAARKGLIWFFIISSFAFIGFITDIYAHFIR